MNPTLWGLPDDLATQETFTAIFNFVGTHTLDEKYAVLERDQQLLLTPHAAEIVKHMLTVLRTDPHQQSAANNLEMHLTLLRRCLELGGLAPAWHEYVVIVQTPAELHPLINEIARINSPQERSRKIQLLAQAIGQVEAGSPNPFLRGYLYKELGNTLQNMKDKRRDNLEAAIACYQEALHVYTPAYFPLEYAAILRDLGAVYHMRVGGNPRDNLETAIACYLESLRIFTLADFPAERGQTLNNLGAAYQARIVGNSRDNLEASIECYQEALRIFTITNFPVDYATSQTNLANAYCYRIVGNRQSNVEVAIACYQEALRVFTVADFPDQYAITQNNLGLAYRERITGNPQDNIELAITYFQEALHVYTLENFPTEYAMVQNNLGSAYHERIVGSQQVNLELAIAYLQEALRIRTLTDFPIEHAQTQNQLGLAYKDRIAGNRQNNLESSLACYQEALRIFSLADFPASIFKVHMNIANLYLDAIVAEAKQRGNVVRIIDCYQQAHTAFAAARQVQAQLGWLESDEQGRAKLHGSHHATREMYARDAWCLNRLGDLRGAVVALEEGRVQALVEAQTIADVVTTNMCIEHAAAFTGARNALREARRLGDRHAMRAARDHFLAIRSAIRAHCRPDILPDAPTYGDIARAAPDQAICYLMATDKGGLALVMPPAPTSAQIDDRIPLAIPLQSLTWQIVDKWLYRTDDKNKVTGGYQYAIRHQGTGVLLCWMQYSIEDMEQKRRLAVRDVPAAISPHFATLYTAMKGVIGAWEREAERLERTGEQRQLKKAAELRTRLAMPLGDAIQQGVLAKDLNYFFQQAELERVLAEMSETFMLDLRKGLDAAGLSDPDQPIALIPCGRLGMLPVHAAWARYAANGEPLPFLETCLLTLQPSARALARAREAAARLPKRGPIFAVGDPKLPSGSRMKQLANAEAEAEAITMIATRAQRAAKSLIGDAASLKAVLDELEVIHAGNVGAWVQIASHGFADPSDPERCYMVLAQGEKLTLARLQQGQLLAGTRLFNASGCQTALGDLETAPDELGSFAAGAMQAGAACTIATLWSVSDQATFLLMLRFARYLLADENVTPAQALRSAVHWLRTAKKDDLDALKRAGMQGLKPVPLDDLGREADEARGAVDDEDETNADAIRMSAQEALDALPRLAQHLDFPQPCGHPYFWAAAVIYGA